MRLTGQPKLRGLFLKRYGNGGETRLLVLPRSTSMGDGEYVKRRDAVVESPSPPIHSKGEDP